MKRPPDRYPVVHVDRRGQPLTLRYPGRKGKTMTDKQRARQVKEYAGKAIRALTYVLTDNNEQPDYLSLTGAQQWINEAARLVNEAAAAAQRRTTPE